jgi:hypothetical protein
MRWGLSGEPNIPYTRLLDLRVSVDVMARQLTLLQIKRSGLPVSTTKNKLGKAPRR